MKPLRLFASTELAARVERAEVGLLAAGAAEVRLSLIHI